LAVSTLLENDETWEKDVIVDKMGQKRFPQQVIVTRPTAPIKSDHANTSTQKLNYAGVESSHSLKNV